MADIIDRLQALKDSDHTIVLQGPPGSGKRTLARRIHARSSRAGQPFVSHDCRGEGLLEFRRVLVGEIRELAPGHFIKYLGLLETVQRGTLYFDTVESLDHGAQQLLARVLRELCFAPIGSDEVLPFRGRVILSCCLGTDLLVTEQCLHPVLAELLDRSLISIGTCATTPAPTASPREERPLSSPPS